MHISWSKKPDDLRFVTVGAKEIKFWNPADATKRLSVKGIFGTKYAAKTTYFQAVTFDVEGVAYTAGTSGSVCVWDIAGQLEKVLKAHTAECTSLIHEDGKLITAGKDNKIIIFSAAGGEYKQLKVIDLELAEGDAVVFYSDGITEAMNKGLEQFGEQRLMDAVAQTDRLDAAGTRDAILKAVREFLDGVHPQDDMTLVVLRVGDERMRVSG